MKRSLLVVGLAVSAATGALWAWGVLSNAEEGPREGKNQAPVAVLMRAKLASSQKVLEGLVTERFDLIKDGANELHKISEAAEWRDAKDPVYHHHSAEFRRLTEKLVRMSTDHNLEGASFTYMHLTTTCISCHQYVRDVVRMTDESKTPHRVIPPARPLSTKPNRPLRAGGPQALEDGSPVK
jgi:hypothetical protein